MQVVLGAGRLEGTWKTVVNLHNWECACLCWLVRLGRTLAGATPNYLERPPRPTNCWNVDLSVGGCAGRHLTIPGTSRHCKCYGGWGYLELALLAASARQDNAWLALSPCHSIGLSFLASLAMACLGLAWFTLAIPSLVMAWLCCSWWAGQP